MTASAPAPRRAAGRAVAAAARRLRSALPTLRQAVVGAVLWGAAMTASAGFGIALREWATWEKVSAVAKLYAVGGALAFPIAFTAARFLSLGRSAETAFAAALVSLAAVTVVTTGLAFAVDYRSYYAEWHDVPGSLTWTLQLVFTTLGALYQFAVLGLRLLLPFGLAALIAAGVWFARLPR